MSQKKSEKPGQPEELHPVEEIARARELPAWETAALMSATGWAPGKQVSKAAFDEALTLFRNRPQGGGRI